MDTIEIIEKIMREELRATHVSIIDESHLHRGHKAAGGGGHYHLTVVSPLFADAGLIDQRRMVYRALDAQINGSPKTIHALQIKSLTPEQWQK